MTKRSRALALALGTALFATGCSTPGAVSGSSPGSVPDDVLFAQVAELPGVENSDLSWDLNFGYTPQYVGTVTVAKDADPMCVLDQTMAILFQGRPGTGQRQVEVVQGDTTLTAANLVGEDPLSDRYGHRPTEPQPRATVPTCEKK